MTLSLRPYHVVICAASTMLITPPLCAQAYPTKLIRIVTGGAGGGSDFVARLIAQGISAPLAQQVIVENRSGAIPGQTVARAAPDGYTLLVAGGGHWIEPLMQKTPYDPVHDFSPISMLQRSPNIVVVHSSLPARSIRDLIALAKANPGGINYGSISTGSANHLAAELFNAMARVDIVRIPYKSGTAVLTDLISGQIQLMFASSASVSAHIKAGRLRALAVTSAQPSIVTPGLPTVAASGLPGYEASTLTGMFAPAKTPDAIVTRLNQSIEEVVKTGELKERFLNTGVEALSSSPAEFALAIKTDMAKWGKLVNDLNIRIE